MFRFLHISDLHIGTPPNRHPIAEFRPGRGISLGDLGILGTQDGTALQSLGRYVFNNQSRLNAIVVTGDVATSGAAPDLQQAFAVMNSTPAPGNKWTSSQGDVCLRQPDLPIFIIPGNHDRFIDGTFFRPGGRRFDREFRGLRRPSMALVDKRASLLAYLPAGMFGSVAILGADFSLPEGDGGRRPLGWLGRGRATPKAIMELEQAHHAIAVSANPTWILWLVHFPPGAPRSLRLIKEKRFLRLVDKLKPNAVLLGHTHHFGNGSSPLAKVPFFISSTTTQSSPNKGFNEIELDTKGVRCQPFEFDGIDFVPS